MFLDASGINKKINGCTWNSKGPREAREAETRANGTVKTRTTDNINVKVHPLTLMLY